jgi:DNA-binding beta-propeller fold protein YncE
MNNFRRPCVATLLLACSMVLIGSIAAPAQPPGYHLVKKVLLGGEGGWDYFTVDPATHRIFIPRGTHTMVLDPDGNVVGEIRGMQGAHGIDLAPDLKMGFTSNGAAHSATVFDLATLQILREVKIPDRNPDSILYDPATKHVFTFNGAGGNDATAFDPKTGEVLGSLPLGGKPETAQSNGAGRIYVNVEDKNQLVEFDAKALKILHTWPLAPCDEPTGLAIDIAHKRLFAGCHSREMMVIDYTSGKIVSSVPIGQGVDANRFDSRTGLAFASCGGDGTITVAHEDSPGKYTVVQTISTQRGARTMALDTANHNIYTVTSELGPPPAATKENPRPRPTIVPNTFTFFAYSQ